MIEKPFMMASLNVRGLRGDSPKPKEIRHSYDILGARMLWKPKEARILKNF
jgi:hypothetical protein